MSKFALWEDHGGTSRWASCSMEVTPFTFEISTGEERTHVAMTFLGGELVDISMVEDGHPSQ